MRASEQNRQKILDFIKHEIEMKGYPPSVREICQAVGLKSTSTVHAHLNHLEDQGLIRRDSTKPRALEVLDGTLARGRSVPLVGRVTAGMPVLAVENIEDYLVLPQSMLGKDDIFCLRVQGESMIDIGILDGDIAVLRQQDSADLIEKLESFLSLPWEQRRDMGLAGRTKVEREFNRDIVIQKYMQEIERAGHEL